MALQVNTNFTTPVGIDVTSLYWRWVDLKVNVVESYVTIILRAYVSETAFLTGKQPVSQKNYTVNGAAFAAMVSQPVTGSTLSDVISNAIYNYVSSVDSEFTSAVAV
jgi:hypothetical protein